jgi:2-polyprenyl-3-methyl-5-hydroxy-6-metoxy-1,4-benzoquinol methylase
MSVYKEFAKVYKIGWYANFSRQIADIFPCLLADLGIRPKSMVDMACGMGDFAIKMAKTGIETYGVDLSPRMLALAKEKAKEEKVSVTWLQQDMVKLNLNKKADLFTCWFDSLNYILDYQDLKQVFLNVAQTLNPQGYFIFDMNTFYGLVEHWNRFPCYVPQNSSKCLEVHEPSFDYEQNIASLKITGFIREGDAWKRFQEIHQEKAYTQVDIRKAFGEAGFIELHSFSSIIERTPMKVDSGRIYFILQKQN